MKEIKEGELYLESTAEETEKSTNKGEKKGKFFHYKEENMFKNAERKY